MNDRENAATDHYSPTPEGIYNKLPGMNLLYNDDLGKLVIRLTVGILMLFHGVAKIRNTGGSLDVIAGALTNTGLPGFVAYGVFVGQVIAPLLLIFGVYCRIGALLIVGTMLFAIGLVHMGDLFRFTSRGSWALELQGFYLFGAAAVAFLGSGRYAIKVRMLPMAAGDTGENNRPAQLYSVLGVLVLIGAGMVVFALSQPEADTGSSEPVAISGESVPEAAPPVATDPIDTPSGRTWVIDPTQSRLGFTGLYAGVEFDGEFSELSATMLFDPENPGDGLFDVTIDTTSINTNSTDRNSMMPEQDWFHFESFPTATYRTGKFSSTGDNQYLATGILNIKGIEKEIDLPFEWTLNADGTAHMTAETTINRIDFGLGARDWADDDTIGFEVVVKVDLLLTE